MRRWLLVITILFPAVAFANLTVWSSGTTITVDCATAGVNCNDGITPDEDAKLKDAAIKGTVGNPTGCANFVCCPERPRIGSRQVDPVKFDAAWKRKRQRRGGASGNVIVRMPTSGKANVCSGNPCAGAMR